MMSPSRRIAAELETMQAVLAGGCGQDRLAAPIARVRRRPSVYATSCRLEEVDLVLDDGSELSLMFKDLSPDRLSTVARRVRPAFLYDPRREIEMYAGPLAEARQGTARCYGTLVDEQAGRYWLFIERIPGMELYHAGEIDAWEATARWLAQWHQRFSGRATGDGWQARLVRYDEPYYRQWPARALEFVAARRHPIPVSSMDALDAVARGYDRVVATLLAAEVTALHGECYASNVMVVEDGGRRRVCPIDWEMAAIGPGLIDLAALTSGRWSGGERDAMVNAYYEAWPVAGRPSREAFSTLLACCRMHVAMQWLGWARDWRPPTAHSQDWLGEVVRLAEELGI